MTHNDLHQRLRPGSGKGFAHQSVWSIWGDNNRPVYGDLAIWFRDKIGFYSLERRVAHPLVMRCLALRVIRAAIEEKFHRERFNIPQP